MSWSRSSMAKVQERIAKYLHVLNVAISFAFHFLTGIALLELTPTLPCDPRCKCPSLANKRWLAADDEPSLPSLLRRCETGMA